MSSPALLRSRHLTYFAQHGTLYAYHNLFGYILAMSYDLVELLEFHRAVPRTRDEVERRFAGQWEAGQLDEFFTVFRLFSCLVDASAQDAEERSVFDMVPLRARWQVYQLTNEAPPEVVLWRTRRDTGAAQGRTDATIIDPLSPWASWLFLRMDGKATLGALADAALADPEVGPLLRSLPNPREAIRREMARWTHADQQVAKLSKAPVEKYGREHQWPSYLRSTMPYAPWDPKVDPPPVDALDPVNTPLNPPHAYYEETVADAEAQFEGVETTLSHLFRVPHPLLRGATYAERLADAFWMRGLFGPHVRRIVEVGGGQGHVAAGLLMDLKTRAPELYEQLDYVIVDLSPALRRAQEARLAEAGVRDRVRWIGANAETLDLGTLGGIDLFVSNEVVGDFTTIKLTRELCGLEAEDEADRLARVATLGAASRFIPRLLVRDAPDPFYLNLGALELVERLWPALNPGGGAFISEYGEMAKYPIASTQLDHLEFSIHFGHLHQLARSLGFEASVEYVQDLIRLDRDAVTLTTTRTYFQSLKALFASAGVALDKIAYTDAMLVELCDGKLDLDTVGDLRFEPVDQRCMGLAPHEFKALLLKKP